MLVKTKLFTVFFIFCIGTTLKAQVEFAHLNSKDFSGFGFGSFLNIAVAVSENSYITGEAGFYYFGKDDSHIAMVPFLLGYRVMLDGSNAGFYAEPVAGYNIGGTDIERTDSSGFSIVDDNGNYIDEKVKGPVAGLVFGYIFSGNFPFNIGLRYEHIFISTDPSLNLLSLRFSYALSFGNKDY